MSMSGSLKSLVTYKPRDETNERLSPLRNRPSKPKTNTGKNLNELSPLKLKDPPITSSNFFHNSKSNSSSYKNDMLIVPPIKTDNFRSSCLPNKIHQNVLFNKNNSYKNEKEILILNKKKNMGYVKNILTTKKGEGMTSEDTFKDDKLLSFKVEDDLIDKYKRQQSLNIRRNYKSGLISSPSKNTNDQKETDPQTINAHTLYVSSSNYHIPETLGSIWSFESINQQRQSQGYTIQNKEDYYNRLKEHNIRQSNLNTVTSVYEDSKKREKNQTRSFISKQKTINNDDRNILIYI